MPQYPGVTLGPLIQISPSTPSGTSRPSPSTNRSEVYGTGRPTDPASIFSGIDGCSANTDGPISVPP